MKLSDILTERTKANDKVLYVYDSGKITELDTSDDLARQRFDNKYGFHEDSLWDFPVERGVRVFEVKGRTIVVSDDPVALAAEVEKQSLKKEEK